MPQPRAYHGEQQGQDGGRHDALQPEPQQGEQGDVWLSGRGGRHGSAAPTPQPRARPGPPRRQAPTFTPASSFQSQTKSGDSPETTSTLVKRRLITAGWSLQARTPGL